MDQSNPPVAFIADAIGLDFLNTLATPVDKQVEWLGTGEDFLAWLSLAKLVPQDVLNEFRRGAGPGELDAIASQARGLREWFRTFVLTHKGQPVEDAAATELEPLNRLLARDEGYAQVASGQNGALQWQRHRRWRSAETLLLPVAEAMAQVVCEEDFRHVKSCEGHGCTMVFLDKTRGHARRWCSMAVCGNRAKQAAHRSRKL